MARQAGRLGSVNQVFRTSVFFYEIKILLMQNKRFRTVKFIKFLISAPFYPVK